MNKLNEAARDNIALVFKEITGFNPDRIYQENHPMDRYKSLVVIEMPRSHIRGRLKGDKMKLPFQDELVTMLNENIINYSVFKTMINGALKKRGWYEY